jgi:hypothetical protein
VIFHLCFLCLLAVYEKTVIWTAVEKNLPHSFVCRYPVPNLVQILSLILVCIWFNDGFGRLDSIALNYRTTKNLQGFGRKRSWPNLSYCPRIFLWLGKITKVCFGRWSPSRDLNPIFRENEARILITRSWHQVRLPVVLEMKHVGRHRNYCTIIWHPLFKARKIVVDMSLYGITWRRNFLYIFREFLSPLSFPLSRRAVRRNRKFHRCLVWYVRYETWIEKKFNRNSRGEIFYRWIETYSATLGLNRLTQRFRMLKFGGTCSYRTA